MSRGIKVVISWAVGMALVVAIPADAQTKAGPFPDVPPNHWAAEAIAFVTEPSRAWIPARKEGFGPGDRFNRRDLARAMYRAFPPKSTWKSDLSFADVSDEHPLIDAFRWAVAKHWLPAGKGHVKPTAGVPRRLLDQALVRALGYGRYAKAVAKLKTEDGQWIVKDRVAGFMLVAERLELYRNFSDDSLELRPGQPMSRAHVADAFERAGRVMASDPTRYTWRLSGYLDIVLPAMSKARLAAARFAFRGAGFPYVWAGEWHQPTVGRSGYSYGAQVQGGFDCSGFVWWVLHKPEVAGYPAQKLRGYEGWRLPWRTATGMADATKNKRKWKDTMPMDVAFYDFDGDRSRIDHVGILLGNGWLLHSSGSKGGVTLERVASGYMRDKFVFARRVIPPKE